MSGATEGPPGSCTGASGRRDLLMLCDARLDPLFWPSSRPLVLSAWYGHVPFAHWLAMAARPGCIVELGTHGGASYSAFCEAVLRGGLPTRCYAVDTWEGDQQSGRYGADVFDDLKAFHDGRYGAFSSLVRASFALAAEGFPPGSVDLLHIDGLHTYAAVKGDFETWLPKLSRRGVVLFHDIAERGDGFEVWRLWDELRVAYPSFAFPHCHGLGLLAVGAEPPAAVAGLCGLDEPEAGKVRARFERLGEPHELRAALLIARLREQRGAALAGG